MKFCIYYFSAKFHIDRLLSVESAPRLVLMKDINLEF